MTSAYNAAKTIEKTYADIPAGVVSQVILVDDVRQDETVEIAQWIGIQVVVYVQIGFNIAEIATPTCCFREAPSVNCQRSVVYSLATLKMLPNYVLDRTGARPHSRFRKKSDQVLSRNHRQRLLRFSGLNAPSVSSLPSEWE